MSMFSRSAGTPADNAAKVAQAKQEVSQQLAMANAQELVNKINEKCYARCVPSPSSTLTSKEQKAISNCMDRYLEAYNIVSRTYVDRITKERAASASSSGLDAGLSTDGFR